MTRESKGYWGVLLVMTVGLAGCASSPPVKSLPAPQPAGATTPGQKIGASAAAPALPTLNAHAGLHDYLDYAALNNPQLKAAFNRWKAALEMVLPARTLPDPRFNYGYFIQEVETRVGPQEHRLGVSQMFPWFGKLKLRGEAAQQAAKAAQQQYEAAKLSLFAEVKHAYYELYYLGRALTVTKQNVNLVQQFEQIAEVKYAAGTASNGDVLKAQVELDKLRDRVRTLQDLRQPTVARLNAALNRPSDTPLPFPHQVVRAFLPADTNQLFAQIRVANPELKRLDFQAAQDHANIALAKKNFYPDITLGLDYIETGPARTSGVPDSGKDPLLASFSVNLPIWWGKYRAEVHSAEDRYAATREAREDLANRLATRLKLALFQFQDADRKIALYRDSLIPKANENLNVLRRSYQTGHTDFLSLIDAERILLEFQLTYARAVANREEGVATIDQLVGEQPATLGTGKE